MSPTIPTNRRRWLRFSTRTILILMVLVAIPMAWKFNRVRAQRNAVQAIRDAGGIIRFDYEVEYDKLGEPIPPGPSWLRHLLGDDILANVVTVGCDGSDNHDGILALIPDLPEVRFVVVSEVSDDGLTYLASSFRIKHLELWSTLTDTGVSSVASLKKLEHVSQFGQTKGISDAGVAQLAGLDDLEFLHLGGHFTDAAIVHLVGLSKLTLLSLQSPQLTDQCIPTLGKMATLRNVRLMGGGGLSEKGIAQLQGLLPNCNVVRIPRPVLQNRGHTTSVTE